MEKNNYQYVLKPNTEGWKGDFYFFNKKSYDQLKLIKGKK